MGNFEPAVKSTEKRKHKLGYQRITVACNQCRKRKIRCLGQEDDLNGRCANCARLSKDCKFQGDDHDRSSLQHSTSASKMPSQIESSPDLQLQQQLLGDYAALQQDVTSAPIGFPIGSHAPVAQPMPCDTHSMATTSSVTQSLLSYRLPYLSEQWPSHSYTNTSLSLSDYPTPLQPAPLGHDLYRTQSQPDLGTFAAQDGQLYRNTDFLGHAIQQTSGGGLHDSLHQDQSGVWSGYNANAHVVFNRHDSGHADWPQPMQGNRRVDARFLGERPRFSDTGLHQIHNMQRMSQF